MSLNEISYPVKDHLDEFNNFFKKLLQSDVSLLNLVLNYIAKKKGKQVRPTLVFLSAEMCGGVNRRSYVGAAMVELLHTATLVHDDVVDEADARRGVASINAAWNNKIAVLIGDYLLAKGLLTSIGGGEFDFLRSTAKAVQRMSEGELLQIQKSRELDTDLETYYRIISDKTASLMSTCCEIGAISATGNPDIHEKMSLFGEYLGLAFQIKDDIFDYVGSTKKIGKPVGIDIKEKKITLPLLYAFQQVPKKESKQISSLIKKDNIKKDEISHVIDFVKSNGGIDYADKIAREYSAKAVDLISDMRDCEARNSLIKLTNFVVDREK